ncbi:hypothetical protein GCM10022261_02820 [Brevibacterium daeguense]|uniref:RNA polymerase primary sigma factor n=2 Tax=Brevibacterium daeguense TaxID=909936 RepID=A0ABP8EFX2_9MICO
MATRVYPPNIHIPPKPAHPPRFPPATDSGDSTVNEIVLAAPEANSGKDEFLRILKSRPVSEVNPHLWQWQREALDTWHQSDARGVIEAVTGAGKTMLGVTAAFEAFKNGIKTLVLVPTTELQAQWQRRLSETIPQADIGTLGNGRHDGLADCDILVSIINSAARRTLLAEHQQGLLIADECHRYAAPTFFKALSRRFEYRLGLTATYARPDQAHTAELDPYFGGVVFRLWYDRALQDNVIAPFHLAFVGVSLNPEERSEYDQVTQTITKAGRALSVRLNLQGARGNAFFKKIQQLAGRENDHSPEAIMARRYMDAVARRQRVLSNSAAKQKLLAELAPVIKKSAGTLVFSETIGTSSEAGQTLARTGIPTEVISSESKPQERRGALQRFALGHAQALCAPRILDEGIDVPEADLAIVVSASRQSRQIVQRLGRVIRRKQDGGPGRYVHLYAMDTIEDLKQGKADHLEPILEPAARTGYFQEHQVRELRQFLLAEPESPAAEPQPAPERLVLTADERPPAGGDPSGASRSDIPAEGSPAAAPSPAALIEDVPAPESPSLTPAEIVLLIDEDEDDAPPERLRDTPVFDDPVKQYLEQIGEPGLLTAQEEVELAKMIEAGLYAQHVLNTQRFSTRSEVRELEWVVRDGIRARERFIACNLRLVVSIAKRYVSPSLKLDFLDIIQEGNLGLVRAVEKFDFKRGFKFSTYATWWIRQAITRAIADRSRTIRLPVHVTESLSKWRLDPEHNRDFAKEAERILRLEPFALDRLMELDTFKGMFNDGHSLLDECTERSDHVLPHPELAVLEHERRQAVEDLVYLLPHRDSEIVRRRHGWYTDEPETLDVIGQRFGVTRERIRQIESKAMTALAMFIEGDSSALLNYKQFHPRSKAKREKVL